MFNLNLLFLAGALMLFPVVIALYVHWFQANEQRALNRRKK